MPHYRYKARDNGGALHTGMMDAVRREAVADHLSGQGFVPVLIEEHKSERSGGGLGALFNRVSPQDLIIFSRQLTTLVGAGIPFLTALTTIERQTENTRLRTAVADIRRNVETGASFSEALAKHPHIFSKLYVSMIRAGETAGILDEILERLAQLAEHDAATRARVRAAVRYPLIVVTFIIAAFAFLVSFVIPKFAVIFTRFKTDLPLPTRILLSINQVFHHYWYIVLAALALLIGGIIWYVNTPTGRRQWDGLKLKLPIFGMLFRKVALSRFARVSGAMQKSGIAMLQTLEIASETSGNVVIARAVLDMEDSLRQGKGLVEPMESSGMFPPLVIQMVAVGEETGSLDAMLNRVSDYYDMDVEYTLRNLSTMIEPILLLVVGGMVLLLALGIFLPMWNLMSLFQK